jgi:hypothetical protein
VIFVVNGAEYQRCTLKQCAKAAKMKNNTLNQYTESNMTIGQQFMLTCIAAFSVMIIFLLCEEEYLKRKHKPYDWKKEGDFNDM